MSKTILIVEGDANQSRTLASVLEARGFRVEETLDGKGSPETIRSLRPDLVLMAVDLSAGQNGYILCGKLKKDDELKSVPLVIFGNPDGFSQHRKLKTHADDYVSKPLDESELIAAVSGLIGLPEGAGDQAFDDAVDEDTVAEEIAVDPDRLDEAFSDLTADEASDEGLDAVNEDASLSVEVPLERTGEHQVPDVFSALDQTPPPSWDDEPAEEATHVGPAPERGASAPSPSYAFTPAPVGDPNELRHLRAQVGELQATLDDTLSRVSQLQGQVQEMELELEQKSTELVAARATAGGASTRDTLALKEAANRKDKEILRLKSELNEKDQEILELRDREVQLETAAAEGGDVKAHLDAQVQTLSQRAEQLGQDKRRLEQELQQLQQESRGAIARAGALETELAGVQAELAHHRERADRAESDLATLRADLESANASLASESERARQARAEVEGLRAEMTEQIDTFAAQAGELREQLNEQQEIAIRNEDRATRLYARIRADEKLREKTKKALAVAQQLLEEQPSEDVDLDESTG